MAENLLIRLKQINFFQNIPIFPHVWENIEEALNRNDIDTALILFSSDSVQPAVSPGLTK